MRRRAKSYARRYAPSTARTRRWTNTCAPRCRLRSRTRGRAFPPPTCSSACAAVMRATSKPASVALEVYFRPGREADLAGLYDYSAEAAGTRIAAGYIDRIEAACLALADYPERGTRRDDI